MSISLIMLVYIFSIYRHSYAATGTGTGVLGIWDTNTQLCRHKCQHPVSVPVKEFSFYWCYTGSLTVLYLLTCSKGCASVRPLE